MHNAQALNFILAAEASEACRITNDERQQRRQSIRFTADELVNSLFVSDLLHAQSARDIYNQYVLMHIKLSEGLTVEQAKFLALCDLLSSACHNHFQKNDGPHPDFQCPAEAARAWADQFEKRERAEALSKARTI